MRSGLGRAAAAWRRGVGGELRPTLALAGPVVAAELGWVAMGVVDTMIVGRLGAEAVGAVGLGSIAFFTTAVFGMGLLLGLDTLVSQAFGAGDLADCRRSLVQGLYLALALTPPLMLLTLAALPALAAAGVNPTVLRAADPYIRATAWSTGPLLVFTALRRFLQATGRVGAVMFVLVSANLVNAAANVALVYGRMGAPAMGVAGSGWATTASRLYMAAALAGYTAWRLRARPPGPPPPPWSWRPDRARLRRLVGLGLPAAVQVTLEVGVFGAATALAARFDAAALAAHQVAINVSSLTFMIPLGLASAGAVRVGQALGRRDPAGAARAGWTTLALAAAGSTAAGLAFCAAPGLILRAFTDDPEVAAAGVTLLYVAAGFQLFDGVQGVTTGNLRGAGDTRTPMAVGLAAHWGLGLPAGYALAFAAGFGVVGLWLGLFLGLAAAGVVLLGVWARKARSLGGGGP